MTAGSSAACAKKEDPRHLNQNIHPSTKETNHSSSSLLNNQINSRITVELITRMPQSYKHRSNLFQRILILTNHYLSIMRSGI